MVTDNDEEEEDGVATLSVNQPCYLLTRPPQKWLVNG
jgi:hypothetical protein